MSTELLEIQPQELRFIFELKTQSSCSVRLVNRADQHVAFKVKTTSPKKYCVRPNTGIVNPKAICDLTVTMQAQRVIPKDMICKDKFLIQCTIVPVMMAKEDITSATFANDGKYVEEKKLRVILVCPPTSPNGLKEKGEFELVKEIEEVKSKLREFELKLNEADRTISKLTEEKRLSYNDRKKLQQELSWSTPFDGRTRNVGNKAPSTKNRTHEGIIKLTPVAMHSVCWSGQK